MACMASLRMRVTLTLAAAVLAPYYFSLKFKEFRATNVERHCAAVFQNEKERTTHF